VIPQEVCGCQRCQTPFDPTSAISVEKRQVFGLPDRLLPVTEHQASVYEKMTKCGLPAVSGSYF